MDYDKHIFISYAHIDNQPLTSEQEGWITRFHASLDALLSMRLGRKARIWRDDKLRGNDVFAEEITDQFESTALLVSVLTPRYVGSDWCTREVREFCERAEKGGGVVVENKSRVFKVLKAPVDTLEALPEVVGDVLGYEFFTFEDGAPLELDPAYGDKFAQDYNRKVGKLAWDASQLLNSLGADAGVTEGGTDGANARKTRVYLAECSQDRRDERERLEADLRLHGYSVLPDHRLPLEDEASYVEEAKGAMEQCGFAIHLVGSSYGAVPDGSSRKSIVELQNELAVELARTGGLQRVIWLPDGTESDQEKQQAFIEALHQDAEAQWGADLLTGDLEELKSAVHGTLEELEKPAPAPAETESAADDGGGTRLVYLICVEPDRKATVPLRKHLKGAGLDVAIPAFEGDAAAVREANQQLLSTCDAVIVFYGAGDEAWKRTIDNELKKMAGYRGQKPLRARCTYLAEPRTGDKDDLIDMEEPDVVVGLEGFDEAALAEFVKDVSAAGATS